MNFCLKLEEIQAMVNYLKELYGIIEEFKVPVDMDDLDYFNVTVANLFI